MVVFMVGLCSMVMQLLFEKGNAIALPRQC